MKRLLTAVFLVALCAIPAGSGQIATTIFTLYGGSNTDSTEQASPWIPIRGASRVAIRLWSSHSAFGVLTEADSLFSDSIAVFKIGFTDSVINTNPLIAGDSVVVTSTLVTNADTTSKLVAVHFPPLQEALRGPGNGSGIYTYVVPVTPGLTTTYIDGTLLPKYMRVYITPLRRVTANTAGAIGCSGVCQTRVNGLKGLRGMALVIFNNK